MITKNNVHSFLYKASWILTVLYFIEHPIFQISWLSSIIWETGILCIFFANILSFKTINKKVILPFIVILGILVYAVFKNALYVDINKIFSVFAFVNLLLLIMQIKHHREAFGDTTRFIRVLAIILALLFIIYAFTDIAYRITLSGSVFEARYFVFNLQNSNTAAFYLSGIACLLLITLQESRFKILMYVLLVGVLYCIWKTAARTAIAATFLVVVCSFFADKIKAKKVWIAISAVVPIVFPIIYMWAYRSGFANFLIGDKTFFSGRQEVYVEYLSHLRTVFDWLLGNAEANVFSNGHNGPISLIVTIGIIGFVCYYFIFLHSLFSHTSKKMGKRRSIALLAILGLFWQAATEGSMFLGGFPGISFVFAFLVMMIEDEPE